jgi:hypothetical protein
MDRVHISMIRIYPWKTVHGKTEYLEGRQPVVAETSVHSSGRQPEGGRRDSAQHRVICVESFLAD